MKNDKAEDSAEYEVGYGKAPKQHRFKEGTSGNPKGRPKKVKTFLAALEKEAAKLISIKQGDKIVKVAKVEALALRVMSDALKGDNAMTKIALLVLSQSEATKGQLAKGEAQEFEVDDEAIQRIIGRFNRASTEGAK